MSKKYENSIWSLCLMKYSPDGNPQTNSEYFRRK